MLHFVGDVHGHWAGLHELDRLLQERPDSEQHIIVQVGDFGWYPEHLATWKPLKTPVYAIDGNHEDYRLLRRLPQRTVSEMAKNLFYVPRGMILDLDGYKIGFAGGAASVDGYWRREGVSWWPDEEVLTADQCGDLWTTPVDVLVTHTPPQSVISAHWPPINTSSWNLPRGWHDPSAKVVDTLWNTQATLAEGKYPALFCGHMHRRVRGNPVRPFHVLDVAEVVYLEPRVPAP